PRSGRAVHRRWPRRPGRGGARRGDGARGVPARRGRRRRDPARRARGHCRWGEGSRKGHGTSDAQVQGPGGRQAGEPDRPRGAGGRRMTVGGGGAPLAARIVAGDLARLAAEAPRTAALRVAPPPKELEQRLAVSLDADGQVQDGASRTLARARRAVREARARLVKQLDAMLAALDPTDRAPDAAVTVREGRYVIPVRSTARARIGGIVHDETATRATV